MAMIYCRECGRKYSDRAKACPKCGYCDRCSDNQVAIYIVLACFFGIFGVHKFYAGKTGQGIAMLLMGTVGWILILPGVAVCIWALVDLIIGVCNINTPEKIFSNKK